MSKDLKAERERSKINLSELSSIFEGREELKEMKQKCGKISNKNLLHRQILKADKHANSCVLM